MLGIAQHTRRQKSEAGNLPSVIPAQAGIQELFPLRFGWQGPLIMAVSRSRHHGFSLAINFQALHNIRDGFGVLPMIRKHIMFLTGYFSTIFPKPCCAFSHIPLVPFWINPMDSCLRRNDGICWRHYTFRSLSPVSSLHCSAV